MEDSKESVLPEPESPDASGECEIPDPLNPTPTDWEKKHAYTDELGARYSADGLKLIWYPLCYAPKTFEPHAGCITICDKAIPQGSYDARLTIPETILRIGANALPKCIIENHSPNFMTEGGALFSADKSRLLKVFDFDGSLYEIPAGTRVVDDGATRWDAAPYFVRLHDTDDIQIRFPGAVMVVATEDQKSRLIEKGIKESQIYAGEVSLDSDEVLYSGDRKTLLCFPRESGLRSYEIDDDCECIAARAFTCIVETNEDEADTIYYYPWTDYTGNALLMVSFPGNLKSIGDDALLGLTDLRVARYNKADEEHVFELLDSCSNSLRCPFRDKVMMIPDWRYTRPEDADYRDYKEDSRSVRYSSDGSRLIGATGGEKGVCNVAEGCRIICDSAFEGSAFDKIVLPDSVEAIGASAFEGSEAKEIVIGTGVRAIEANAFRGCRNLRYLAIPPGVYYTGDGLFLGCESLRYIVIPASVLRLDIDSIPQTISKIYIEEDSIFLMHIYENPRYAHKVCPVTSTTALPHEFDNAIEVNSVLYSADRKKLLSINGEVEELDVPEGTEMICDEAFNNLTNPRNKGALRKLTLPSTLKEIGGNAFCGSINDIKSNSPKFVCKEDMLLSEHVVSPILYYYYGSCDGDLDINNIEHIWSIKDIWSGAFTSRGIKSVSARGGKFDIDINSIEGNPFLDVYSDDNSARGVIFNGHCAGNYSFVNDCLYSDYSPNHDKYWEKERKLIGYYGCAPEVDLRGIELGEILKYAFFGCLVEKVCLPSSIVFIHPQAFEWCFGLRQIVVAHGQKDRFARMLPLELGKYVVEE